jgi:hypothetical protein
MKVYQIVEGPESGFGLGKKTPGGLSVPDNFDMKKAPLTFKNGELRFKLDDGTVLKAKSPSDLANQIAESKSPKAKLGKKIASKAKAYGKKIAMFFTKSLLLKLTLGAQGFMILRKMGEDKAAFKEMWQATYPAGHTLAIGSPYHEQAVKNIVKPIEYSAYAAAAVVCTASAYNMIRLGRAAKLARAVTIGTTPLMVGGPIGWIIKGVLFALTEGAIWAAGWTIQRYGPDLFHYWMMNSAEDMKDDLMSIGKSDPPPVEQDIEAVKAKIKKELQLQNNGTVPKPPKPGAAAKRLKDKGIDIDNIKMPD